MERATYDLNFEKITPLRRAKCNYEESKVSGKLEGSLRFWSWILKVLELNPKGFGVILKVLV